MASRLKYFIFNKPFKILSQFSDEPPNKGLSSILELPSDIYPVGRLDLDSEGLLLLTNDKKLNYRLLDPKQRHSRIYWAQVEGRVSGEEFGRFQQGLEIRVGGKPYQTLPSKVKTIRPGNLFDRDPPVNVKKYPVTSWLEIQLIEGKNRQVRKMMASIGHPTLRLIRIGIEQLTLGDLAPGEVKMISQKSLYQKLNLTP